MDTVIQKVSFPENKRILVFSDAHAHKEGVLSVLKQANFSKDDILVIVGGCGIKKEEQINLLIFSSFTSKNYTLLTWDGLPTVRALDNQEPSSDFGYIRWGDDEVTVLENGADTAKVMFRERIMTIPAKRLYQKNGVWRASEITDYLLPVSKGNTLSVIEKTPRGLYAKKNGVTGWYMGRYE